MLKIFYSQKIEQVIKKHELIKYDNYLQESINQNDSTIIKNDLLEIN